MSNFVTSNERDRILVAQIEYLDQQIAALQNSSQQISDQIQSDQIPESQAETIYTGFPFPLQFECEVECAFKDTPEHIKKWVNIINEVNDDSVQQWNALSIDEQYAILLHLKAFEIPYKNLRFYRFHGCTERDDRLKRIWPNKSFNGTEEDINEFVQRLESAEDIFDHIEERFQPRFIDLKVMSNDGSIRSFGSSYEMNGHDNEKLTIGRI